jgi:hypothetical protein
VLVARELALLGCKLAERVVDRVDGANAHESLHPDGSTCRLHALRALAERGDTAFGPQKIRRENRKCKAFLQTKNRCT